MDLADFQIFEAVARLGGINRAALELNTVQSNVTTRLRRLEEELGVRLFNRTSRGAILTAAGQRLLPFAYQIRDGVAAARQAVMDDGIPRGPMAIGSLETTMALRLSPALARFAQAFPLVDINLRAGTTSELVQAVLLHELEGAFVCGPVKHASLAEITVFEEELVLMAPPAMTSLAAALAQPNLRIAVLKAGCSYRQRLEEFLARRGIAGLRVLEFGTLEALFGSVAAGLGITALPRALTDQMWDSRRIALFDVPAGIRRASTVFVHRRDSTLSPAVTAFVEHVRPPKAAKAA